MNRRDLTFMMAGTAISAALPKGLSARSPPGDSAIVSRPATALYRRALVLDGNSIPPWEGGRLPLPQEDLDLVRGCGVDVIKWSISGPGADFEETVIQIAEVQRMFEVHPSYFTQVRVPIDIDRAKREHRLGIILSFEAVDMLEGRLERIDHFRNFGIRVMQLSYNGKSAFAAGVMAPEGGGLTPLGHQAVKKMNALGITIDASHANDATTADLLAASSKPVIVSHAGCAAIHPHPRNKTDDQLRAIANKGGVIGIYDLMYLTASPRQPSLDDYLAHMEHALKVAGADSVGVGSDVGLQPFDVSAKAIAEFNKGEAMRQRAGLASLEEDRPPYVVGLNSPRRIEIIADQLLTRDYPQSVAEKVLGANFARVFRETWTD